MDTTVRFLHHVLSTLFGEEDDQTPATRMHGEQPPGADVCWTLLLKSFFLNVGDSRDILRLVSKLTTEFAFVCQRRVPREIISLITVALQGVLGIRSLPGRHSPSRIE